MAGSRTQLAAGAEYLLVGRIRKPHGVRGELFVWPETDRPDVAFRAGQRLQLGGDSGPEGDASLVIERARPFKDGYLLKPEGSATRDEALEQLRGRSLYILRSDAAPLAEDEVYYHELIGLRVVAGDTEVGTVREVYEGPATDLLVVARTGKPELLVPFVREIVTRVDVDRGEVLIDPPAGLLEM